MRISASGEFSFEALVGFAVVEAGHPSVSGFDLDQHFRKISIRCRAADHGNIGGAFENLVAFLLGNAAEDTKLFALGFKFLVIGKAMKNFLFSFIANRAGVVKDKTGFLDGWNLPVSL